VASNFFAREPQLQHMSGRHLAPAPMQNSYKNQAEPSKKPMNPNYGWNFYAKSAVSNNPPHIPSNKKPMN
jgi:hypothetical protein